MEYRKTLGIRRTWRRYVIRPVPLRIFSPPYEVDCIRSPRSQLAPKGSTLVGSDLLLLSRDSGLDLAVSEAGGDFIADLNLGGVLQELAF